MLLDGESNTIKIGKLNLRNPVMLSAGTLGDSPANLREAYNAGAGAVVTKSITWAPRTSNPGPDMVRSESGGWLNAVGLANPGAEKFAEMLGKPDYPVIVSMAGTEVVGFELMVDTFACASGFEINLSCPNVPGFDVGDNPGLVGDIVKSVKHCTDVPVFAKIGHHMVEAARAAADEGIDGIVAINSIPAMEINPETKLPIFSSGAGGLSGPPIKPVGLRTVHDLAGTLDVQIIGCGGISTWQDAADYITAGATAVQVGSAAMNDVSVLGRISHGLEEWRKHATSG